jgi:hypothetical protein
MKFYGIYPAIVIQNNDPEKAGRVKVFVPGITNTEYDNWNEVSSDKEFSFVDGVLSPILISLREVLPWAVNASPVFGGSSDQLSLGGGSAMTIPRPSGTFSIPNVGSHVFIFFIAGDINNPVFFAANHGIAEWTSVMGDSYPSEYENAGGGTYVNKHVINTNKHYIELIDDNGKEEIKIFSGGNIAVTITGNATVSVAGQMDITAGGAINITAGGACNIKGATVNLN